MGNLPSSSLARREKDSHFPTRLSSGQDTSVSTLWTPSGEHDPEHEEPEASGPEGRRPASPPEDGPAGEASRPGERPGERPEEEAEPDPELVEELRRLRQQLAATPVADIVANHAVGLWQLAIVHLAPEDESPPNLDEARLAVDGMASLVDGLADRLGAHEEPLRDALAQLRLVFVQVSEGKTPEGD